MNRCSIIMLGAAVTLLAVLVHAEEKAATAQEGPPAATAPKIVPAGEMQWRDGPPSLPAGAQVVVLDGDPSKQGSFTMRLKMPAGYSIPPHTHPTAERVTVISGAVRLGIGEKFDANAGREMEVGDFAVIPAGVAHFASSSREAVLQIQSEGPFTRKFVNPADDSPSPRK